MARSVKCGLIQATNAAPTDAPIEEIKPQHRKLPHSSKMRPQGVQIFACRKFLRLPTCAPNSKHVVRCRRKIPDGPTVRLMQEVAKNIAWQSSCRFTKRNHGVYYNTAAVLMRTEIFRKVSSRSHSARRARLLGKVLFQAGQFGLSDI